MRKVIVIMAVLALAVPAMAELGNKATAPIYTATADSLRAGPAVYDSIGPGAGGYFATAAASGPIGWDDYDTNSGVNLTAVKFVGGVTRAGGIMWFSFFDPGGTFVTSFGVQFPQTGNYLWTITFNNPPFVIPHTGLMQVYATDGAYGYPAVMGQWYLTTPDAVIVGTNNPAVGFGAPDLVNAFSFHVPEPTTLALLGMGMLALVRRR